MPYIEASLKPVNNLYIYDTSTIAPHRYATVFAIKSQNRIAKRTTKQSTMKKIAPTDAAIIAKRHRGGRGLANSFASGTILNYDFSATGGENNFTRFRNTKGRKSPRFAQVECDVRGDHRKRINSDSGFTCHHVERKSINTLNFRKFLMKYSFLHT